MITNFIRELKKLKYFSRVLVNYSRMNTNEHDDNDAIAATTAIQETLKTLKTEDTGKIFEKAICDAYGIPYDGPFQYCQTEVDKLTPRLKRLVTENLFPMCKHTASKGSRYDFTALVADEENGKVLHLSAKSNKKKGGKVAPQVVGQATPQKFWDECVNGGASGETAPDPATMKKYIQENIMTIMPILWRYTFDSPMVYYVRDTDQIRFITPVVCDTATATATASQPDWSSFQYSWSRPYDKWTNSTSLRVVASPGSASGAKEETIMEFQFHTKSRQNMAIRWTIDKVLSLFAGHFKVTEL
jgi:hypothetical protein